MLRKKLSKLIVAVMAAVMLSGGMSGVGQAVFASSNASVVSAEARTVANVDASTTDQDVETYISDGRVSTLKISTEVKLTKGMVDAINARTQSLTIEVTNAGSLVIPINTFTQPVTIDGNGKSNQSLITIARGVGKTGALLRIDNGVQSGVVIKNVIFRNGNDENQSAVVRNGQDNVTLDGNNLVGKGSLVEQNGALTGLTLTNNSLGEGKLLSAQTLPVTFDAVPGSTVVTLNGSIKDDGASVNVQVGSKAVVRVRNASNNVVFEKNTDLDVTNGTNGTNGRFTEARFSLPVTGLAQNSKYTAEVRFDIVDDGGNKYTRVRTVDTVNIETKGSFSSTVTSTGNNSATITLNHGNDVANIKYPLKITVSGGTATPSVINAITNLINVTGLASGTSYTYEIIDDANTIINTGAFTTTSSTITGGGSTGGSVTSGDLTTNDINRGDIKDVSSYIPVGNTTLANSLRDGRDYKTNIEGVTVTYSNGKVEFTGLVPEKDYRDLTITYTDKDGRTRTVKVPSFKTKVSETKLRQFIVDVYRYSLDRVADERGFAYWEDQLKNKKTSPDEFVKNLLNEREFINKHTTTTAKIEGLYQVIVNRKSDSQGLSFWTKKYDDLVARGYSESMALRVIVDEMVNEQEFKNRVRDLGL